MAVEAPDKEERENPVRNFVKGTDGSDKIRWVKAEEPDGTVHKLNVDNTSDWQSRGPGYRVVGPWTENTAAVNEDDGEGEDDNEDDDNDDDNDDGKTPLTAPPSVDKDAADEALKELVALRTRAAELGVTVNEQWGKKRLQREIDGAILRQTQE